MTSTPIGQPRPPFVFPPPSPFRAPSRRPSIDGLPGAFPRASTDTSSALAEDLDDGRAAKRRKLDQTDPSSPVGNATVHPTSRAIEENSIRLWRPGTDPVPLDHTVNQDQEEPDPKPPPWPARPWKTRPTPKLTFEEGKCGDRTRKKVPVPNIPDKIAPPANAPGLGKCGLAGYFAWGGKHPEDSMSESHVKHGYSDRPPNPAEKELASGRSTLYKVFKEKSGLNTLSALFALLLDQKNIQAGGSSASTFKPPPRVTMTEAKRKTWLTDLANPDVPLRRLNRTIPQGIRGQALLEQCLAYVVPVTRALWFAKCVGANEIRTLKRKGPGNTPATGNETKWLREWTVSVQQFVESTLRQVSQQDWKTSIYYVLQLSTRLYMENLADREQYLDWIVRSMSTCGLSQTPFWLMVTHIFIRDLTRFRKRGRKVAMALTDKLKSIQGSENDALRPLVQRLRNQIRSVAINRPLCFLIPDQWLSTEAVLKNILGADTVSGSRIFQYLNTVNEHAMGATGVSFRAKESPCQRLLKVLDAAQASCSITNLARDCRSACDDSTLMISILLDWSVTRFRAMNGRIYLVARLIQHFQQSGLLIETALFGFFNERTLSPNIEQNDLRHLFSALAGLHTFSTSRYLQWLNIRGALSKSLFNHSDLSQHSEGSSPVYKAIESSQMLTELPLRELDAHVVNLRNALLTRGGWNLKAENDACSAVESAIRNALPVLFAIGVDVEDLNASMLSDLRRLPWSIRSQVAGWLREHVLAFCSRLIESFRSQGIRAHESQFHIKEFCLVRNIYEHLGDHATLADIIMAYSGVPQEDVLAACVDTLDRHQDIFEAVGVFEQMHDRLGQAYVSLKVAKPSLPLLATSLLSVSKQHMTQVISARSLRTDLVRGDRGAAIAACSPFSDGVAESLQQAGESFMEDFEAILQSEHNMNEETMTQLFGVLVERLTKAQGNSQDAQPALCQLLTRLRLHRSSHFDSLMKTWLSRHFATSAEKEIPLIRQLVSAGCLEVRTIIAILGHLLQSPQPRSQAVIRNTQLLFGSERSMNPADTAAYKYASCLDQFAREAPVEIFELATKSDLRLGEQNLFGELIGPMLCNVVLEGQDMSSSQLDSISNYVTVFLSERVTGKNVSEQVTCICQDADDFTWRFARAAIAELCSRRSTDELVPISDAFFALATTALDVRSWSRLLPKDVPDLSRQIRVKAIDAFFASLPLPLQSKNASLPADSPYETCALYVQIALAASQAREAIQLSTISSQLVEKLTSVVRALGASSITAPGQAPITLTSVPHPSASGTALPSPQRDNTAISLKYLPLLLQVLCLHRSLSSISNTSTATTSASKQTQQDHIKLLVLLVSIALHPTLQSPPSPSAPVADSHINLTTQTLNVAATLVDDLGPDALALCARFLKDKIKDPRVQFLFGSFTQSGNSLLNLPQDTNGVCGAGEVGAGLQVVQGSRDAPLAGAGKMLGEWKPRVWEVLEGSGNAPASAITGSGATGQAQAQDGTWVSLGMFGLKARK